MSLGQRQPGAAHRHAAPVGRGSVPGTPLSLIIASCNNFLPFALWRMYTISIAIDVQKKIREREEMDWTQHERYGMPSTWHPNHATLGRRYLS